MTVSHKLHFAGLLVFDPVDGDVHHAGPGLQSVPRDEVRDASGGHYDVSRAEVVVEVSSGGVAVADGGGAVQASLRG